MIRACHTAVRMATGDAFSEEEINDFLDRLSERAIRARKAAPTLDERAAVAQAAGELTRDALRASLEGRKLALAAKLAQGVRRGDLAAMPAAFDEARRVRALNVGDEGQGFGTSSSIDAEGRALSASLWGQVQSGLDKVPGLKNRIVNPFGLAGERGFDRLVARELARIQGDGAIEPTGDEGALWAARVLASALERGRTMQNEVGAFIGKLEGYIARQSHDRERVAGGFWRELGQIAERLPADKAAAFDWAAARAGAERRGFRAWRDYIRHRLHEKTFEGLDEADAPLEGLTAGVLDDPTDLRERFLYRVWFDIVSGRHEQLAGASDLGEFRPPASKARTVSRSRVLHFQDPDAWVDYNQRYGSRSLFSTIMGQLDRAARNTALMRRWGPAPEAAWTAELDRLDSAARTRGSPAAATRLMGGQTRATFEAVNGTLNIAENLRVATVARGIRNWELATKLGQVVLSKITDPPIAGQTFARAGLGFLSGYEGMIRGMLGLEGEGRRQAAELLDVGARAFAGHMAGRMSLNDGTAGWSAWAAQMTMKMGLFEHFNEAGRRGVAAQWARHMAQFADRPMEKLPQGVRETFERFGIDGGAWDLARRDLTPLGDGLTYLTLDNLDRLPDRAFHAYGRLQGKAATPEAAARLRAEVGNRFRAMVHNIIDDTTAEPRLREQAAVSHGKHAGTVWGEAARSFWQLRGFATAVVGRHLVPAARGFAGYSPVATTAHLILGLTLAGWLSLNAKRIVAGKTPLGLTGGEQDAEGKGWTTPKIWTAALLQGGGLGLYGDFLAGDANRAGKTFSWASMGGPAVSDSEQIAQIVQSAIAGGDVNPTTGRSPIPAELLRLAGSNIPVVNLWYTRLAIDYLILWRLQEAASPGYLQRYESRERDQGGGWTVAPTSAGG